MRIRYGATQDGRPVKKAIVYTRDEHSIRLDAVDKDAVYIVERLRANGYETYIVGGAVRDLILGRHPKDFDIVSAASPARIKRIFRNSRIIGRRFRLVHVYFGPKIFEVSTFRSLKDGPTSNTYGSIEEDVLRRDFSLNALFYDPLKEIVVDYVGGMKDIREKRVRPIIPLSVIFKDDPVRMIRAVKYAAATSFKLPWRLVWKLRRQAPLLSGISPSRLTEEILKIVHSPYAARIIENLEFFGLYGYLQPEASALLRRDTSFRSRYIKGFADLALKAETVRAHGESMAVLIRDFLEETIDWEGGIIENYKTAFLEARRFVLPMNPPRAELDHAVRLIFGEHGLTVKKSRFLLANARQADPRLLEETPETAVPVPEGEPKRRRRRGRRRGKAAGAGRETAALPSSSPVEDPGE
ncbi:MAG: polynucleotide adenylyltransferase PcnB [Treponema sp.]|nr:polynucleotide adenylyltransferase PcnB [Treponema sp.]